MSAWEGLSPPYATIVADPPWPIRWGGGAGGLHRRATPLSYSLMSTDVAALPVGDLAAADSHLFLWATAGFNRNGVGVQVAEAWGFRVTSEIIWEKPNFGMGVVPRACHEILLIASRGSLPWRGPKDIRSVQRWPQVHGGAAGKIHSAKPAESFDLIEQVSPGPYVELFARAPRLGWDHWGYGYEQVTA